MREHVLTTLDDPAPVAPPRDITGFASMEGRQPRNDPAPELGIIIPTFNEAGNVTALVRKLEACLQGIRWEAVFVDDDSRDGTLDELHELSRVDSRIRYLHRIGRRGLASAVVEGILATGAPCLAVIDCDLQHDETKLPVMLEMLRTGEHDIVVGSRYLQAGGFGEWSHDRIRASQFATRLAGYLLPVQLSDPMSGFFMLTRGVFMEAVRSLSKQGYKILLDIILSSPRPPRVAEVPYTFRNRVLGESKLDHGIVVDYLMMLLDKAIGHVVPARFILFGAVGGAGVLLHMSVLALALLQVPFAWAQALATMAAMTFNFFLNNLLTYRDKQLKGPGPLLKGLMSFYAVCSIGAVSNVGVASVLFDRHYSWWLSATAGILVGVVWNYAMTATFTWRR